MPIPINCFAVIMASVVVLMQAGFGALELFAPHSTFNMVFASSYNNSADPLWCQTGQLARNMGLYNWFIALGLLLSLTGPLAGAWASKFFLLCVGVAGAFALISVSLFWAFWAQLVLGLATFALFQLSGRMTTSRP